jgi:hypothetical protein
VGIRSSSGELTATLFESSHAALELKFTLNFDFFFFFFFFLFCTLSQADRVPSFGKH